MSTLSTSDIPCLPQATQAQPSSRRPYRSKRNRPCTLCRSRKISCRIVDNDVSCTSCRKGGRHCSFVDDPPPRMRIENSVITEPVVPGREPSHVSIALNTEQPFNWNPVRETVDDGTNYDDMNDRDRMELSAFYESTQDLTNIHEDRTNAIPWLNSSADPLRGPHHAIPGLNTSLHDIDPQFRSNTSGILSDDSPIGIAGDLCTSGILENSFPIRFAGAIQSPGMENITGQPTAGDIPNGQSPEGRKEEPNSIDQRPGFHSSYFGLSGECDPYLLRHVLYDELDEKPFNRFWYRSTENRSQGSTRPKFDPSTPNGQSSYVPAQFMLIANELVEEAKKAGPTQRVETLQSTKLELDGLISDEHGRRLILLFMEYIFPALPVISRTQLARSTLSLYSSESQSLDITPPYLLAAIYASALQFGSYDDVLCVSSLYQKPSVERLWQMVYDGIQLQIHSPRLVTLSAALLYLNKSRVGVQNITVDTPFTWTFTASSVALATSLGLHMDCISWSIPKWEKRLRRRLWWMTFSEEKWRSLLLGRPSIIAKDQWSVSRLTDSDFEIDQGQETEAQLELPGEVKAFLESLHSPGNGPDKMLLAQQMASLALIADDVYTTLYTIRAAQSLADDLNASICAIKPLRESLVMWYSNLPTALQSSKKISSEVSTVPLVPNSVACLHFAYITLEILLYRALLRPLENVDFGLDLEDSRTAEQSHNVFGSRVGYNFDTRDVSWDLETLVANEGEHQTSFLGQAEAIICAAEQCATVVTTFTAEMMSWDFAGFWYSWSRIGWATTSSFLALLLVQSPSLEHAMTAKASMDKWRQILRHQSKSFQDMSLGMTRLDAMYWSDMRRLFRVNKHLDKVLRGTK